MRYEQDPLNEEDRMVAKALARVGIIVESVYDLVNTKARYPVAIPVLLEMLPRVNSDRINEGVSCLS